jgi:hypothetical protein
VPTPSLTIDTHGTHGLRIHVFGHQSAHPEEVAHEFGGLTAQDPAAECDLAIFAINPSHGIDTETIAQWEALNDSMVPRLIVVTGLENSEADFDDAVLLANRVFDQTVTPYLVLHDELGVPCALISLKDLQIIDYATTPATIRSSDPEHQQLVSEFRISVPCGPYLARSPHRDRHRENLYQPIGALVTKQRQDRFGSALAIGAELLLRQ